MSEFEITIGGNSPALTLALPEAIAFQEWLSVGHNLAAQKRHIDWLIGDWVTFGREHFPEQIEFALGEVVDDNHALRRIEKTVRAFPPHLRDKSLSFDHHAHVADMPVTEALPLLKKAHEQHLSARALRVEVMVRKLETGQILAREEDVEDDALLALVRAWNRAPRTAREDFAEMVAGSHYGVIDPSGKMG